VGDAARFQNCQALRKSTIGFKEYPYNLWLTGQYIFLLLRLKFIFFLNLLPPKKVAEELFKEVGEIVIPDPTPLIHHIYTHFHIFFSLK
jgi:hypothetical protein